MTKSKINRTLPPKPTARELWSLRVENDTIALSVLGGPTPRLGFERWLVLMLWERPWDGYGMHWSDVYRAWSGETKRKKGWAPLRPEDFLWLLRSSAHRGVVRLTLQSDT